MDEPPTNGNIVEKIRRYNKQFVEMHLYEKYWTDKYPDRKIAILSCMDTRLTELLPAALGLKNGDVKLIKNAGALISHPYGSVMRSLMVAVYDLEVETVLVIGHDDCGMQNLDCAKIISQMLSKGISLEMIQKIDREECSLEHWLSGFQEVYLSVEETVRSIKEHPFIHEGVQVVGFVMDPGTGELKSVVSED